MDKVMATAGAMISAQLKSLRIAAATTKAAVDDAQGPRTVGPRTMAFVRDARRDLRPTKVDASSAIAMVPAKALAIVVRAMMSTALIRFQFR